MLHRLREFSLNAGAVEPGFKPQAIRWALVFSAAGEYRGAKELGDPSTRRNPGKVFPKCPRMDQVGDVRWSQFLWHDLERIIGWPKDPRKKEKTRLNQRFFLDRLVEAAEACPALGACAAALGQPEVREQAIHQLQGKAKPSDSATIEVGGVFPLEDERLLDWWRANRERIAASVGNSGNGQGGRRMRCLLTGELAVAETVHPFIQGMSDVGGNAKSALVSFNEPAFCSFRLQQSTNAAISEQPANEYAEGLNTLIRTRSRRLISHRYLQRVRDGAGTRVWTAERPKPGQDSKVVLWFSRPDINDLLDSDVLLDPSPLEGAAQAEIAQAELRGLRLLSAIHRGERPDLGGARFYSLVLSAATSRVMVRQWQEGPLRQFADAIVEWFCDLEIVDAATGQRAPDPAFAHLVGALARKRSDVPPASVLALWLAAIGRREFAPAVQAQALRRMGTEIVTGEGPRRVSAALLKACVLRCRRRKGNEVQETIAPGLREDHPHPAYQCGRLMAELAAVQKRALGDVGAGVIQRYFTAASATPCLVFGRLLRNSQHHLEKLQPGLRHLLEGRIAGIVARIGDRYPGSLDLEGQSMFALGYYQQIAENRRQQEIRKAEKESQ